MSGQHGGVTAPLLALGLILAQTPTARAQEPAPAAQVEEPSTPGTAQIATGRPSRPRRPPLDPTTLDLRQTRGILAGGIVLTALCGAGFGLLMYAVVDTRGQLKDQAEGRAVGAGVGLLSCTFLSIAAIGVASKRLRTLKSSGRVAWTGGLGLRF